MDSREKETYQSGEPYGEHPTTSAEQETSYSTLAQLKDSLDFSSAQQEPPYWTSLSQAASYDYWEQQETPYSTSQVPFTYSGKQTTSYPSSYKQTTSYTNSTQQESRYSTSAQPILSPYATSILQKIPYSEQEEASHAGSAQHITSYPRLPWGGHSYYDPADPGLERRAASYAHRLAALHEEAAESSNKNNAANESKWQYQVQESKPVANLDPSFKVQRSGFFKIGRVFKILWPEYASDSRSSILAGSLGITNSDKNIHVKVRWFVIIREGYRSCSCLPIQTYSGRGVSNPSITKWHHAIIYSSENPPEPIQGEQPTHNERGMGPPIRVTPRNSREKLSPFSRVNFQKVYTVEDNVKVYDFGKVHPDFEVLLIQQFNLAWGLGEVRGVPINRLSNNLDEDNSISSLLQRLSVLEENMSSAKKDLIEERSKRREAEKELEVLKTDLESVKSSLSVIKDSLKVNHNIKDTPSIHEDTIKPQIIIRDKDLVSGERSCIQEATDKTPDTDVETDATDHDDEDAQSLISNDDSESSSFDPGPTPLPDDLTPDDSLVNPRQWINRLEALECKIIEDYVNDTPKWNTTGYDISLSLKDFIKRSERICSNLKLLKASGYCNGDINCLVLSTRRKETASMVNISNERVSDIQRAICSEDLDECVEFLKYHGLPDTAFALSSFNHETEKFLEAARAIVLFLEFAVVSFVGAHLESFDVKYLGGLKSHITVWTSDMTTLTLKRRSLKCLDEYLHHRKAWVFEEQETASSIKDTDVDDKLYISTTMRDFEAVWGPVWVTYTEEKSKTTPRIRKFNVGLGWVIPWNRTEDEPELVDNEIFAHWTNHPSDLIDSQLFPELKPESRLLIGGTPKLSQNAECKLSSRYFTQNMRSQSRLNFYGTRRPVKERDSQTATVQLSAFGLASSNYQETYKIREGSLLRERLLAMWTYEPEKRNPSILVHWVGVEISACTENARRRRLCQILASPVMRNFLTTFVIDWDHAESQQLYLEAVQDKNIRAFESLYINRPELRKDLGRAVALCLQGLAESGSDCGQILNAIWCPSPGDTWMAKFSYWDKHWVGLLKDTIDSCALVVVTPDCLVMKDFTMGSTCQNCSGNSGHNDPSSSSTVIYNPAIMGFSFFETGLIVNDQAVLPKGLKQHGTRWRLHRGCNDAEFDLGESGRLNVCFRMPGSRGVLMRWSAAHRGKQVLQNLKEALKLDRSPCHREQVLDESCTFKSMIVHVVSSR